MADCKIVNKPVVDAVANIAGIAAKFKTAGETLETDFKAALAAAEGDAKDALIEFFDKNYKEFLTSDESGLPAMIKGLSDLLEGNRTSFTGADTQIADGIRNGGK